MLLLLTSGKHARVHERTSQNPYFIPTAALWKKFLAYISLHMLRYEIFPTPCIWAKSEFLEAPMIECAPLIFTGVCNDALE